MSRFPGMGGAPNPPIAYAQGHAPECFLPSGTYLRCVPGCQAHASWGSQMNDAYEIYDKDMAQWRAETRVGDKEQGHG